MRLPIVLDGISFPGSDRGALIKAFIIEYEFLSSKRIRAQREGQLLAKETGSFTGREPLAVPLLLLAGVKKNLKNSDITVVQAMDLTKLSKATLYRRFKKLE